MTEPGNEQSAGTARHEPSRVVSGDLCIVGSGIAGLNALFAASRYLASTDRVVLVDRRQQVGGMWNDVYEYVRLHQPHPHFTAGNIRWQLGRPPSYLPTGQEVLSHLEHCLETLRQRVQIEDCHGYEYATHEETPDGVQVHCTPVRADGQPLTIRTRRLIKAIGGDIRTKPPLDLSSDRVRSVSPNTDDVLGEEMARSDAPVYVVGGGKTGMDTAHALLQHFPEKKIRLLIGLGTMFMSRDKLFPTGARRWWGGSPGPASYADTLTHFDGTDATVALDYFRSTYCVTLTPKSRRFMFGTLSAAENDAIASGADEVILDYLDDVVDKNGQPTLLLHGGDERTVEPESWFINTTGYLPKKSIPYEPYISESGKTLSIRGSSGINPLTSMGAYILVHLLYLGELDRVPLYEADFPEVRAKSGDAFPFITMAHTMHNMGLAFGALSRDALRDFDLDLGRWYPAPRQMVAGLKFIGALKSDPDLYKRKLDRAREHFGIRCGPLPYVGGER